MVRRWRDIAEIHLVGCRQIEVELGLSQHLMVKKANNPAGLTVSDVTKERWFKVPFPSGWGIARTLIFGLITIVWVIAFYLTGA